MKSITSIYNYSIIIVNFKESVLQIVKILKESVHSFSTSIVNYLVFLKCSTKTPENFFTYILAVLLPWFIKVTWSDPRVSSDAVILEIVLFTWSATMVIYDHINYFLHKKSKNYFDAK